MTQDTDTKTDTHTYDEALGISADIITAYVSHNAVNKEDLIELIGSVYGAVKGLGSSTQAVAIEDLKPAVPVRKSVTAEYIICLEDGKKFKSLKRHLRTHFNLSPEEYREKWGLPADYPMVAPSYSATRSKLARDNGLGRKAA